VTGGKDGDGEWEQEAKGPEMRAYGEAKQKKEVEETTV